jgi:hypothetical protein
MTGFNEFLNSASDETEPKPSGFDTFLSGADTENRIKQSLTAVEGLGLTPDQAAEAKALSKKTGIPAVAVEPIFPEVKKQAERLNLLEAAKNDPAIAKLLEDPNAAKIMHDDVDALTKMSDVARALPGGAVQATGMSLSGIGRLNDVAARSIARNLDTGLRSLGLDSVADVTGQALLAPIPWWLNPSKIVGGPGDTLQKTGEAISPPAERQNLATDISGGLGQIGAQIATVIFGGPTASIVTLLGQGAEQQGQRVDEVGKGGTPESDAALVAGAGITALTERFGLEKLLDRVPPNVKNAVFRQLADVSIAGGIEAAQEVVEGILQNLTTRVLVDPNQQIVEGLDREALAAGGAGALARGLINAATRGRNVQTKQGEAEQAVQQGQALDQVVQAATASKTLQRDPETFKQFIGNLSQRTGVDTVYVPAEKLVEYYQSQDIDPFSVVNEGELSTALATGGDVAIPLADYVSDIAPQHHAGLAPFVKVSETGWTPEEAQRFNTSIDDIVAQEDEALRGEMERMRAREEPAQRVFEDVRDQLVRAGRSRDVADKEAAIARARAATMAERLGYADAWEYHSARKPLTIQREFTGPDLSKRLDNLELFVAETRRYIKKQQTAQNRPHAAGKKDLFGNQKAKRSKATPKPVLNWLQGMGGLKADGRFARELAAMDITPKSNPRLFANGKRGDVDNIPASEFNDAFEEYGLIAQEDGNGYVDRDWLLSIISDESFGNYAKTQDERNAEAQEQAYDELRNFLGNRGLDIETASIDEIRAAIEQDTENRDAEALYQADGTIATESEAFKKWFGDSKVVDENGKPLVVYHGTKQGGFEEFNNAKAKSQRDNGFFGQGIYFTSERDIAESYADDYGDSEKAVNPQVYEAYVSIKNPFVWDVSNDAKAEETRQAIEAMGIKIQNISSSTRIQPRDVSKFTDNLKSAGYDGVVVHYPAMPKFGEVVAFEPTQIKSVFNRGTFDPNDARILYQNGERDLLVQHNIRLGGLMNAEKLGGLPVPSLAIAKKDAPLEGFGEITLLADKNLIDPQANKASKVFGADVYSPRYPSVSYEVNDSAHSAVNKTLQIYAEKISTDKSDWWQLLPSDIEDKGIEAFEKSGAVALKFLEQNGLPIPPKEKYDSDGRIYVSGTARAYVDAAKKAEGYSEFVLNISERVIKRDRIFDGFTNDGRRRYLSHNLDTVVRILKRGVRDGEGFNYGVGSIRSKFTKQFRTIKQIVGAKDKIVSPEKFDALKKETDQAFMTLADKWQPISPWGKEFGFLDTLSEQLKEAATRGLNAVNKEYFGGKASPELLEETAAFLNSLRDMPTEYFEAKIQRAVQLDEFAGAVVPDGKEYDAAAEMLASRGLDVQRYKAKDEAARKEAIQKFERIFFQRTGTERGSYTPSTRTITLFETANLSTFIHEQGHDWLEQFRLDAFEANERLMGSELTDEQVRKLQSVVDDYTATLKYLGADGESQFTTEQHEMFARTVEAYFMEGKAPSVELQGVFQRFKAWLVRLYREVSALNVPINDEIRSVLDRMLATEAEIDMAQQQAYFESTYIEGATGPEQKALNTLQEQATAEAERQLLVKAMEPIRRQREQWWKEEWRKMQDTVRAEAEQQPAWRALAMVRGSEDVEPVKLDLTALEDQFGTGIKDVLPRGATAKKNGIDPDMMAEAIGLANARALVDALRSVKDVRFNDAVKAETDRRMLDVHGDVLNDGTIEAEAQDAIRNEKRGDAIAMELKILRRLDTQKMARRAGERRVVQQGAYDPQSYQSEAAMAENGAERLVAQETARVAQFARAYDRAGRAELKAATDSISPKAVREAARRVVGQMQVRHLGKTAKYASAELQAAEAARKAISERDYEKAAFYKYRQMLNHYLYIETKAAGDEAASMVKYLDRLASKKTIKTVDQDNLEQIHGLLEKYDLKAASQRDVDRRKSFAAWVAEQEAAGREVVASEKLINLSQKQHYSDVPLDELRTLRDTVKQIEHFGRLKQTLRDRQEQREFDELVTEATDQIERLGEEIPRSVNRNPHGRDKVRAFFRSADAALLKIEQVVDWLDGGNPNGIFNRVVFRRIAEAQVRENDLTVKYVKGLEDIFNALDKKRMQEFIEVPSVLDKETGKPIRWQRSEIMAVALNMGNKENLSRLMSSKGEGWTQEQIDALTQNLNAAEAKAVQDTWDLINSLWPDIEAMEKSLNGIAPPKVEAKAFDMVTADGLVPMNGGYYPLVYDPSRDFTVAQREERRLAGLFSENGYVRATTEKGHTKERVQNFARPLLFDLNVIPRHISQVVHDIAYREAIIDVDRFTSDGRIKGALARALGDEIAAEFRPWLQAIASDRNMDSGAPLSRGLQFWNRAVGRFRTNATIVGMGFRFTTMMAQVTGLSNSAEFLGTKWVGVGLKEFYGSGNPREIGRVAAMVLEKSGEMRHRHNTIDRDIRDGLRKLTKNSVISDIQRFAFYGIAVMDRGVAMPTWLGAYNKALAENMGEADAIAYADKAVRMTQGAGGAKDLAAVQRGTETFKLFTMFYSYFNVMYNRQRDIGRGAKNAKSAGDYAALLARSWWLMVVPAVLGELLTGRGPGDDEDEATYWATRVATYPFMGVPIMRDIVASSTSGFDYQLSPVARAGQTAVRFGTGLVKVAQGDDVDPQRLAKNGLDTLGYAIGLPTGQIGVTGGYIWDVLDGDENPENALQFARGVTIGPPR